MQVTVYNATRYTRYRVCDERKDNRIEITVDQRDGEVGVGGEMERPRWEVDEV